MFSSAGISIRSFTKNNRFFFMMLTNKISLALLAGLSLSLLAGCGSSPEPGPSECPNDTAPAAPALQRITTLQALEEAAPVERPLIAHNLKDTDGTPFALSAQAKVTFSVQKGRVSGSSGVNRYSMAVAFDTDGTLTLKRGLSTLMAGPEQDMRFEHAFTNTLPGVTAIALAPDGTLVLSTPDEPALLVFGAPEEK